MHSVLAKARREEADQSRAQTRGGARASPQKKRTRKQTKTEGMVNSQELKDEDMVRGATAYARPPQQPLRLPDPAEFQKEIHRVRVGERSFICQAGARAAAQVRPLLIY